MIQFEKLGIFLSKPMAYLLMVIYLTQSCVLAYLVMDKYNLEQQIAFQQRRISELEDKLQILKAIGDFQIGFKDDEIRELTEVVYSESKKYQYDPMFILAIILTESTFKRNEVSPKGARGLMQVAPITGEDVAPRAGVDWEGLSTLNQPGANVKLGTAYLFEKLLEFKDIKKALLAYNLGETRLRKMMRTNQPLPSNYLNKVIANYRMLKETYKA
ncbi:MAG: lytic transglycosylase domain-containing protein [candidate division Zixibacteria bacterium]|nr:lytic transglycosylase domain-containing protein [candidate division Zixibacteria bacterium]